jgi:hypothetical protein
VGVADSCGWVRDIERVAAAAVIGLGCFLAGQFFSRLRRAVLCPTMMAVPKGHALGVVHVLTVCVWCLPVLLLLLLLLQIEGHTICALGDAAAWPVQGLIRHFRWGSGWGVWVVGLGKMGVQG